VNVDCLIGQERHEHVLIAHRLLDHINGSVNSQGHSLDIVAKDNRLFLSRDTDFHIERLSLQELTELLITTRDLLNSIRRIPAPSCRIDAVLDAVLDETYLANLEHLLLCLRDQLIRLVIARCVGLLQRHISECQKDQSKHNDYWFFEFPDARHPLSTTWPWSIRPALAVLWGVCWMFYDFDYHQHFFDNEGNMCDIYTGQIIAPRHVVQQAQQYRAAAMRQHQQQQQRRPRGIYPSCEYLFPFVNAGDAEPSTETPRSCANV
jgi:hypothetical protein